MKHLFHAALALEAFVLGASMSAGHAPTWLLVGLVVLSGVGVLLAIVAAALRH
ncbi:hypothetical protein [Piscinibacter defluvii]|uniref:hypothetical protein n=1 Tax=Piscinibacter defluvii TaxID=1796922 RepID=UPI0013E32A0C|nr:hypothetical protein [Piscinibacter defluvii]